MKLSTRARYGMRALVVLARAGASRTSEAIAREEELSKKYMDEILGALRSGGILLTKRGVSGGYALARDAAEINLLEVVELLDGPTALAPCTQGDYSCNRFDRCGMSGVWSKLNDGIRQSFAAISLHDVIADDSSISRGLSPLVLP